MKASTHGWTLLAVVLIFGPARAADLDAPALRRDFANARDLEVVTRWQELPADALKLVQHVAARVGPGKPALANIGEEWSYTDAKQRELPSAQHLFSAVSDTIAATVFLTSADETDAYAMVARRSSEQFCLFKLPRLAFDSLRISEVQYILRAERDRTAAPPPPCTAQSLDRHINWPR